MVTSISVIYPKEFHEFVTETSIHLDATKSQAVEELLKRGFVVYLLQKRYKDQKNEAGMVACAGVMMGKVKPKVTVSGVLKGKVELYKNTDERDADIIAKTRKSQPSPITTSFMFSDELAEALVNHARTFGQSLYYVILHLLQVAIAVEIVRNETKSHDPEYMAALKEIVTTILLFGRKEDDSISYELISRENMRDFLDDYMPLAEKAHRQDHKPKTTPRQLRWKQRR